jgi:WD40 repeat protein
VKLYDAASGGLERSLAGAAEHVAFSPDGRLAMASREQVRLYELAGGQEVLNLSGHLGLVLDLTFSRDGRRLATASFDRTVKLWDAPR